MGFQRPRRPTRHDRRRAPSEGGPPDSAGDDKNSPEHIYILIYTVTRELVAKNNERQNNCLRFHRLDHQRKILVIDDTDWDMVECTFKTCSRNMHERRTHSENCKNTCAIALTLNFWQPSYLNRCAWKKGFVGSDCLPSIHMYDSSICRTVRKAVN